MNWEKIIKIKINYFVAIVVAVLGFGFADNHSVWQRAWARIPESQTKKIFYDTRKDGSFWVATSRALYYVDSKQVSSVVINKEIGWLSQDSNDPDVIYLAAQDGVYTRTGNKELRNVLLKHGCLSVTSIGKQIFVGTKQGLMIRNASSERWINPTGKLATEAVHLLASYGNLVYISTPTALYRYESSSDQYKEIFSTGVSKEGDLETETIEDERTEINPEIFDLDIVDDKTLYVSARNGIYATNDAGHNWEKISLEGLPLRLMTALSVLPQEPRLWAATSQGVYRFIENRWKEQYQGLHTNLVYDLAHDDDGNLYAATNRGFFILSTQKALAVGDIANNVQSNFSTQTNFRNYMEIEQRFKDEPSVSDVQKMAVIYADVHPDKIKRWHRQSRLKAFVPTLSTGIDRSATDLMHWDTGGTPDVLSKGRDFIDWDVNLSWNLGDMVWSSDQTSIDSRSKLMVELREEVLDQVTRIYFERRRLQVVLLSNVTLVDSVVDDQMRLAELTAIIDGYTGGGFSRAIEDRS